MILPYRLDQVAEHDIEAAKRWYEERSPWMGLRFVEETFRVIHLITAYPLGYPKAYRSLRRALLSQFPYAIAYELMDDEVVVLAVLHQKQNPQRLASRLGDI